PISASCARTWTSSSSARSCWTRRTSRRCARTSTGGRCSSWTNIIPRRPSEIGRRYLAGGSRPPNPRTRRTGAKQGALDGLRRGGRKAGHPGRAVGLHEGPQEVVAGPDRGDARPPRPAGGVHLRLGRGAVHLHLVLASPARGGIAPALMSPH